MCNKLTQYIIKKLLNYDPTTGILIWKIRMGPRAQIGGAAGCLNKKDGYRRVKINGTSYLVHRLIWLWVYGYLPEKIIDHKDRNPGNNKVENLRESSQSCNIRNKKIMSNNKSGVTGVSLDKKRNQWVAYINTSQKRIYLGSFKKFEKAVKTRWVAEKKYKFPKCSTTSSAYQYLQNFQKGEN